ncbi:ATP-binding domain-containing protein [Mycolicibacterium vanbaalenii]|nr:ATP-binding domain-containing protein [Mycolicibacterium vanbaalenii]
MISTMPGSVQAKLGHEERWQNVKVLGPNHARGLEFDAVVVVEPADFPRNDDRRQGLLYTALTRANKELVIVHSKPLPLQLQEQQDRGSTAGPKPIQVRRPATAAGSPKAQRKSKRRRKRARRKFNSMH